MLKELYLLETYFETPFSAMCEDDFLKRFGAKEVQTAYKSGFLRKRFVNGSEKNEPYYIYSLSDKGRAYCGDLKL